MPRYRKHHTTRHHARPRTTFVHVTKAPEHTVSTTHTARTDDTHISADAVHVQRSASSTGLNFKHTYATLLFELSCARAFLTIGRGHCEGSLSSFCCHGHGPECPGSNNMDKRRTNMTHNWKSHNGSTWHGPSNSSFEVALPCLGLLRLRGKWTTILNDCDGKKRTGSSSAFSPEKRTR